MASLAVSSLLQPKTHHPLLCETRLQFHSTYNVSIYTDQFRNFPSNRLVIVAKARKRANTRTLDAKTLNRNMRRKYNGTALKPRLSVFCSEKQLYAMLVDDQNKKCLFYGSTLQKGIRERDDTIMSIEDAARVVGEELVKAAVNLNINEISTYDCNRCSRIGLSGQRIKAFEIAISSHGFLPR